MGQRILGNLFIIGAIAVVTAGFDFSSREIPVKIFIINITITTILAILFSLFYFKDKKIKANAKEGLYFDLVLIVVGFALDLVFFLIGALASNTQMDIFAYYSNPLFWVAVVLLIATTTIVGAIKGRK